MCGIAGIYQPEAGAPIERSLLQAMGDVLRHRGPDGSGLHIEPHIGFAHRRLSIIDLAHGAQPLRNAAGSVSLVYNGEIYNFRSLREELQKAGHVFLTQCDTEVVLKAWEQWGEECVERFRGMFAFALWDRERQTFFLARDRLGIKPLYYGYLPNGAVLFGSELKALLVHPDLVREPDLFAVEEYLAYGYVPDPRTILKMCSSCRQGMY
jgi:asparagine synthase (glutamine-hydrolysing)